MVIRSVLLNIYQIIILTKFLQVNNSFPMHTGKFNVFFILILLIHHVHEFANEDKI